MEQQRKKNKIEIGDIMLWSVVAVFVLTVILGFAHYNLRKDAGTTTVAECKVVDKYRDYHASRFGGHYSYHVVFSFEEGQRTLETTIDTSEESFYEDVLIGDKLSCEVTHDDDGIIGLEILDSDIEQYTTEDSIKTFLIIFGVVIAVMLLIIGGICLCFIITERERKNVSKG